MIGACTGSLFALRTWISNYINQTAIDVRNNTQKTLYVGHVVIHVTSSKIVSLLSLSKDVSMVLPRCSLRVLVRYLILCPNLDTAITWWMFVPTGFLLCYYISVTGLIWSQYGDCYNVANPPKFRNTVVLYATFHLTTESWFVDIRDFVKIEVTIKLWISHTERTP